MDNFLMENGSRIINNKSKQFLMIFRDLRKK
jgi:hypothetical protein